MKRIAVLLSLFVLVAVPSATATNGKPKKEHKVYVCHKGKTLSVSSSAVAAHKRHGDTVGRCVTTPPPNGDTPVTAATFEQVNRVLACASKSVARYSPDGTRLPDGIAVDLNLDTFESGLYEGATFTIARWYAGEGATCDNLGGSPNGESVDGYPVWVR